MARGSVPTWHCVRVSVPYTLERKHEMLIERELEDYPSDGEFAWWESIVSTDLQTQVMTAVLMFAFEKPEDAVWAKLRYT